MLGYMNREALRETLTRGRVVFYSRSRQCLWEKGETSGHTLSARWPCAPTAIATPCWSPPCPRARSAITAPPPASATSRRPVPAGSPFSAPLEAVIARRIADRPEGSYTARLSPRGRSASRRRSARKASRWRSPRWPRPTTSSSPSPPTSSITCCFFSKSRGLRLEDVVAELESRHAGRGGAQPGGD